MSALIAVVGVSAIYVAINVIGWRASGMTLAQYAERPMSHTDALLAFGAMAAAQIAAAIASILA